MSALNPFAPQGSEYQEAESLGLQAPSYLQSADFHNIVSQKSSWFEDVTGSLSRTPEFVSTSILSGLNSFYNTGTVIGNLFSEEQEKERSTAAWIASIDSDFGKYYKENAASVDLAGFIATSFIPGIGGIKALNMGQKALAGARTGLVGENLGAALGLATPRVEMYMNLAAADIAAGRASAIALNTSGLKAISAGVYQNVLEGIAFEGAVQATMFKSPILESQDVSDIAWNLATGGFLGGAIGGAFHTASTFGKIKTKVRDIVASVREPGSRGVLQETGRTADEIIWYARDKETGPTIDPGDPNYLAQVEELKKRQTRIDNDMRAATHKLTPGNQVSISNQVADINYGASSDEVMQRMVYTDEITSIRGTTKVEQQIKEDLKAGNRPDKGLQVQYWKLHGEDAGVVLDRSPPVINLADTVVESAGKTVREQVLNQVRSKGFHTQKNWDPLKLSIAASTGHLEAEARYIYANDILAELKSGTTINALDIPLLQRAERDQILDIKLVNTKGEIISSSFDNLKSLQDYTVQAQEELARLLQTRALQETSVSTKGMSDAEKLDWVNQRIAKITNMQVRALEGTGGVAEPYSHKAWQAMEEEHKKFLASKGLKQVKDEEYDPRFKPSWAKVTKIVPTDLPEGTVIDAIAQFEGKQKAARESIKRVAAKYLGELSEQLGDISKKDLDQASHFGTGASMLGFAAPEQGGLGSKMALTGSVTQRASQKLVQEFTKRNEGAITSWGKSQEAIIEWGGINQKTSRSAMQWVPHTFLDSGENVLISTKAIKAAGGKLDDIDSGFLEDLEAATGVSHTIPVKKAETWEMVKQHVREESSRTEIANERAAALGRNQSKQLGIFRPIPPNLKEHKHFVLVKDPKVTGQGHTSMIFAETPERLKLLAQKAKEARPDLEIIYNVDSQDFFRARGTYEYDRAITENAIDSSLKNEGILSDYFIKTDPQQVINDYLNYHTKRIDLEVKETIRARYQPEFDWLEDQAKNYSRAQTSQFGGNFKKLEDTAKNPYLSYIKTGLNLSRANENPLWYSVNKSIDELVSNAVGKVQQLWEPGAGARTGADFAAKVDETNRLLQHYGMNTGYVDAATQLIVNDKLPRAVLTKTVRSTNAILSRITLGMDWLNSVVNGVSSNVLRYTELKHMLRAVREQDPAIAGRLTELMEIDITGNGDKVFSASKLIANGMKAYFDDLWGNQELIKEFKQLGVIRDISDQFKATVDLLAFNGTEGLALTESRIAKASALAEKLAEKGEKWTGNKHMEEMNRFVTAWGMKQMTDPLVAAGKMSKAEAYSYINTHVNRVEGNMLASQRPFVFQGPIGQAISLFQTYQFNLMQQMFRYVADGTKKDAAMLLGLQGTFFGIQGLPAFQAINQHIIGTASGNQRHIDAYDATYGIAGKQIGDMLLYGLPSNLLQTNLYSRGDINPRHVTILPTALNEVPVVGATMKFLGAMKGTYDKIGAGGNVWQSVLQGIEHNGISRPLAGFAQTLQATTGDGYVMSTTSKGSILFQNDLLHLATLSRLAGGRPLDEAIVNDGVFRVHSYALADRQKMLKLAGAVKASAIAGQEIDPDQVVSFTKKYVESGGRAVNFNKFMVNEIRSANKSTAEKIITNLKNPSSQKLQLLLGGGSESFQSLSDGEMQ